jgi:propionyl-CoA synthetase
MNNNEESLALWNAAAQEIDWYKPWEQLLDTSNPPLYRWFAGASCNTSYNCLDRHVDGGRGEQTALIYDSPVTGQVQHISYRELRERVAMFAGALANLGLSKGDRVVIYMPMVPEAAVAMQACARLGAVHSVVFGGFAANELASRIDDCKPTLIIAASCGIEPSGIVPYKPLLDSALELTQHQPDHCVILQREQSPAQLQGPRDIEWDDALRDATPAECVAVAATDPLYRLCRKF